MSFGFGSEPHELAPQRAASEEEPGGFSDSGGAERGREPDRDHDERVPWKAAQEDPDQSPDDDPDDQGPRAQRTAAVAIKPVNASFEVPPPWLRNIRKRHDDAAARPSAEVRKRGKTSRRRGVVDRQNRQPQHVSLRQPTHTTLEIQVQATHTMFETHVDETHTMCETHVHASQAHEHGHQSQQSR